jgi:uncharacterized membrane protein
MPDPIKISVVSTQKSSNKVKGNKGKYKSVTKQSIRSTRNKGNTIDFVNSQNKQKGEKGRYKSKGTRLTRHKDGSCTMSTNKVRGEKGKYKTRKISKARCSKMANSLTRKHSKM